jgi:predicted nicotinamide N-methyase
MKGGTGESEPILNKRVDAVFNKILHRPAQALAVPTPNAEKMVNRRLRLLANYTQPGTTEELKVEFKKATKLTATCH